MNANESTNCACGPNCGCNPCLCSDAGEASEGAVEGSDCCGAGCSCES